MNVLGFLNKSNKMTIKEFIKAGYTVTVKYNNRTFWEANVRLDDIGKLPENGLYFDHPIANDAGPDTIEQYLIWGPEDIDHHRELIADNLTYEQLQTYIQNL